MSSNISYHAFVIDEDDRRTKLLPLCQYDVTNGWQVIAHHVTVGMGPTQNHLLPFLGKTFEIELTAIGFLDDRVLAVKGKVKGFDKFASSVKFPHITLSVNRKVGAKPYESNKIRDWKKLPNRIIVKGTLYNLDNASKIVK